MAVANSLAGVQNGARQVECTINGIGERAGNASLEEIAMAMRVRADRYPYETAIVSEQIFASSQMLAEITGVSVQPNKAIIGRNAFAHEAGIHQDGMLKNPLTYEIMTPQSVGVPDSRLVLGKHSGRHALALRCEQLGHKFERRELDEIYRKFVVLADRIKQRAGQPPDRADSGCAARLGHDRDAATSRQLQKSMAALRDHCAFPAGRGRHCWSHESSAPHHGAVQITGSRRFRLGRNSVRRARRGEQEDYLWGVYSWRVKTLTIGRGACRRGRVRAAPP